VRKPQKAFTFTCTLLETHSDPNNKHTMLLTV